MGRKSKYDDNLIKQAIKLSEEKGCKQAAKELEIPYKTVYNWYTKNVGKKRDLNYNDIKNKDFAEYDKEAEYKKRLRLVKFLKEELSFDIDGYVEKNAEKMKEKRDFIEFLLDSNDECQKGSIFQLLEKSHLENIYNEYSEKCTNNDIYKYIYKKTRHKLIENEIDSSKESLNQKIQFLFEENNETDFEKKYVELTESEQEYIDYLFSYEDHSYEVYHKNDYRFELIVAHFRNNVMFNFRKEKNSNNLDKFLKYIKENFTDGFFDGPYELKDNLTKSFFNLLICHQIISKEIDKINMNNSLYYLDRPDDNYIEKMTKCIPLLMKRTDIFELMINYINGKKTECGTFLWNCITYDHYDENDIKYYKYAIKTLDEGYEIYYGFSDDKNYEDDGMYNPYLEGPHIKNKQIVDEFKKKGLVSVVEIIAIMQELIYMKKYHLEFDNKFYNNKNIPKDMVNKLKNNAEAAAKRFFVRCVQNRIAYNFGNEENMKKWREIENELYSLKIQIFKIYDIDKFESTMHSILLLLKLCK